MRFNWLKKVFRRGKLKAKVLTTVEVGLDFTKPGSEFLVLAERFQQSYSEFVEDLKACPEGALDRPISIMGDITYEACIIRTLEELHDELRHIQGLMTGLRKGQVPLFGCPHIEEESKHESDKTTGSDDSCFFQENGDQ